MKMPSVLLVTAFVFALRALCAPDGSNTCSDGCQTCCRNESGKPYCCSNEPRHERESLSLGTIIIIAVGVSIILVAIALLIYCNCRQGNLDENPSSEASSEAQDDVDIGKKDNAKTEQTPPAVEQTSMAENDSSETQYDAIDTVKKDNTTTEQTPPAVEQTSTAEDSCMSVPQ